VVLMEKEPVAVKIDGVLIAVKSFYDIDEEDE
jgi:hypothetical protein